MNYKQELEEKSKKKTRRIIIIIISILISSVLFIIYKEPIIATGGLFFSAILLSIYFYFKEKLEQSSKLKKMEAIFPDFLQLMSSNLRAGMTVDKALLLSSRPEFAPLDKEILRTGRDITTGKNIEKALEGMAKRIGSEKIKKTIMLIISGIRSGGNIAILLEQTSSTVRERNFLEKKSASNVFMYVIFIFAAVSIFSPALFSLSNVLVGTLTNMLGEITVDNMPVNMPISFSEIKISPQFINYFSIVFIILIDLLASLVMGLVNKGDEKEGLKLFPIILTISLSVYFLLKFIVAKFMATMF